MTVRELTSPPRMALVYPRVVAGSTVLPLVGRVPVLGSRLRPGGDTLPDTELVLPGAEVDREALAAYARVCGFRLRDELPATYPHVLAFPLAMALMSDPAFPFPAIGLVHVRNRIELLRAIGADEALELRVRLEGPEPHERGTQFFVVAETRAEDEVVWRGRSTYLRRHGGGSGRGGGDREREERPEPSSVWSVPGDIGRRYASVSGDSNPIHLHALGGKLLGLPGAIAHGMWTKARCLAALEGSLPAAFAVDVRFRQPIVLPAKVGFGMRRDGDRRVFAVVGAKDGRPHVDGVVEPV